MQAVPPGQLTSDGEGGERDGNREQWEHPATGERKADQGLRRRGARGQRGEVNERRAGGSMRSAWGPRENGQDSI
eukprot:544273-Pleurochrysis_carterae.AAC.5